jgi:hypothetical protein
MINTIVILEAVAMVFYIIATYLCVQRFKQSAPKFQLVFLLMILALIMGALTSLTDVLQWANIESIKAISLLFEGLEEAFTPLFGLLWIVTSYTMMMRTKKTPKEEKKNEYQR